MRALALALLVAAGCGNTATPSSDGGATGFDENNPEFACGPYPGRTCFQYELFNCQNESPGCVIDQLEFIDRSTVPFLNPADQRTPSTPMDHDLCQSAVVVALVPDRAWPGNQISFDVQAYYHGSVFGSGAPVNSFPVTQGMHYVVAQHPCLQPPMGRMGMPCGAMQCPFPGCCADAARSLCVPQGQACNGPSGGMCMNGQCQASGCGGCTPPNCCDPKGCIAPGNGCPSGAGGTCVNGSCQMATCGYNGQPCCVAQTPCPNSPNRNCGAGNTCN